MGAGRRQSTSPSASPRGVAPSSVGSAEPRGVCRSFVYGTEGQRFESSRARYENPAEAGFSFWRVWSALAECPCSALVVWGSCRRKKDQVRDRNGSQARRTRPFWVRLSVAAAFRGKRHSKIGCAALGRSFTSTRLGAYFDAARTVVYHHCPCSWSVAWFCLPTSVQIVRCCHVSVVPLKTYRPPLQRN